MSRAFDSIYEIEMARRNAIINEQICSKTEVFYNRYLQQYNEMIKEGFEHYIPNEMNRLKGDLNDIRTYLSENKGFDARDESQQVGRYISSMFALGRSAIRQFERQEMLRIQQLEQEAKAKKNDNLRHFYQVIQYITDPVVVDFMKSDLNELKEAILNNNESIVKLGDSKTYINEYIEKAKHDAIIKADDWKKRVIEGNKKKCQEDMIEQIEDELKHSNIEDKEKSKQIVTLIDNLKSNIQSNNVESDVVHSEIQKISKEIDDTVISESIRKEAVRAIVKSLRKQEFTIEETSLIESKNKNFVKIVATKPSGKRAECRVESNGKLKYKFDNYDGMTCIEDIEQFDVDLKEIYSVSLSNEKVIWENPIRISKDSKQIKNTNKREV